jgi:hypothetical protein
MWQHRENNSQRAFLKDNLPRFLAHGRDFEPVKSCVQLDEHLAEFLGIAWPRAGDSGIPCSSWKARNLDTVSL